MKYIKFAIIMTVWFLGHKINAQTNCTDQINTTTPTINLWDWRTQFWEVNYRTVGGPPVYLGDLLSPFWDDQNSNTKPLADVATLDKDNKPEDGWELISKNMGMGLLQGDAVASLPSAPYVLLYNKYTAKLRIYLLVVQLFSGVANNDASTGGNIKVMFVQGSANFVYQSNLLTTNTSPMLPLDKFTRNLNIITPNAFRNTLPYWLYADIPVAYDPCTCLNKGQIRIEAVLNNNAQVNLDITGVPRSSPINNNQTNTTGSDFLTGFSEVSGKINGGLKAAATVAGTVKEFKKGLGKAGILTPTQLTNIDNDISEFEALADQGTALLKLIPQYGDAISSIVSFIDYFVSGGKSSKGETPSGVVIMNDFKATGNISSTMATNAVSVLIPGCDSQGTSSTLIPKYNNTLGVFNLLRTPEVSKGEFGNPRTAISSRYVYCGPWDSYTMRAVNYRYTTDVYVRLEPNALNEAISYVVNPAIYPDMELSDVKVAIQIAGISKSDGGNMVAESKTTVTYPNGNSFITDLYRTEYYPIGQANGLVAHVKAVTLEKEEVEDDYLNWCSPGAASYTVYPQVNLKIVARIKRKNTTKPEEDIIFIATYPVKYRQNPMASRPSFSNPSLSDIIIPAGVVDYELIGYSNAGAGTFPRVSNPTYRQNLKIYGGNIRTGVTDSFGQNYSTITAKAYNITLETQKAGITYTNAEMGSFTSAQDIDLVIEATAGDIIFEAKNTAYQAPVSPANVFAFCNTDYKVPMRNQSKTVETQAEEPKDVPTPTKATQLLSVYPNPTTGEATITYEVEKEGSSVAIYLSNNLGIRVMEVSNEVSQVQGTHNVRIDTRSLAAGVYFYTLVLNGVAYTERLVVIK